MPIKPIVAILEIKGFATTLKIKKEARRTREKILATNILKFHRIQVVELVYIEITER